MKIYTLTSYALIITVLALTALFTSDNRSISVTMLQGNSSANLSSLRAKALQAGGKYIGDEHADFSVIYDDIKGLARQSSAVIVGAVLSNKCVLSANEETITTDYQVSVQEVIKGRLQTGSTITVQLPGGLKSFANGTLAEVRVLGGLRKMRNGETHVLFLEKRTGSDAFVLTGGPQGAFNISKLESGVMPADRRFVDPIVQKYRGTDIGQFLDSVRGVER